MIHLQYNNLVIFEREKKEKEDEFLKRILKKWQKIKKIPQNIEKNYKKNLKNISHSKIFLKNFSKNSLKFSDL